MNDRVRFAADLASIRFGAKIEHPSQYEYDWADRLIALGWTLLDEERLARAIDRYILPPEANRPMSYVEARRYVAAAIAEAYREDTDATS